MTFLRTPVSWSRRAAMAVAVCIVVPPPLVAFSACAAAEQMDGTEADSGVIIPAGDSGGEASSDAAQDSGVAPCAVGNLCSVPTPLSRSAVIAMNGRSKSDVWASGNDGVMIHWDGQRWTELESSVQGYGALSSIVLTSSEAWGVVGSNHVLRRGLDPSSVRLVVTRSDEGAADMLNVVAVFGVKDAYVSVVRDAYGFEVERPVYRLDFESGALSKLPGPVLPGTTEGAELRVRASFLVPDKALWLVGDRAAVARYPISSTGDAGDGGAAGSPFGRGVVLPIASHADLLAAWGYGDELWAAGRNGVILHFDGTEWSTAETGTKATFNAIFGLSPNDIWAAGDSGTVLHFDGNTWSPVDIGAHSGDLKAIWASAPDDVWIGGDRGMFHWGALQ